jgi:hypothetical protein
LEHLIEGVDMDQPHGGKLDAEKPELRFFDSKAEREQAAIDKAFPGTTNRWPGPGNIAEGEFSPLRSDIPTISKTKISRKFWSMRYSGQRDRNRERNYR